MDIKYASFLQVQNRWKQEVLAVIDKVTDWEMLGTLNENLKPLLVAVELYAKWRFILFFKMMRFVHLLCFTTLEFVCSTRRDWTKAYIIGHIVAYITNSYEVVIHIFLPPGLPPTPLPEGLNERCYMWVSLANFGRGWNKSIEDCLGSFLLTLEVCWCSRKWCHLLSISKCESKEVASYLWCLNGALLWENVPALMLKTSDIHH